MQLSEQFTCFGVLNYGVFIIILCSDLVSIPQTFLLILKNIAFLHSIWYNILIEVDRMYLPGTSGEIIGDLRTARGLSDV